MERLCAAYFSEEEQVITMESYVASLQKFYSKGQHFGGNQCYAASKVDKTKDSYCREKKNSLKL